MGTCRFSTLLVFTGENQKPKGYSLFIRMFSAQIPPILRKLGALTLRQQIFLTC
jgi:hypothetical protein